MLTCKEASYLASKRLDQKLAPSERLKLWLHIAVCRLCRLYARDIKILHMLILKAGKSGQEFLPDSVKLSGQSRERIKQALAKAIQQTE